MASSSFPSGPSHGSRAPSHFDATHSTGSSLDSTTESVHEVVQERLSSLTPPPSRQRSLSESDVAQIEVGSHPEVEEVSVGPSTEEEVTELEIGPMQQTAEEVNEVAVGQLSDTVVSLKRLDPVESPDEVLLFTHNTLSLRKTVSEKHETEFKEIFLRTRDQLKGLYAELKYLTIDLDDLMITIEYEDGTEIKKSQEDLREELLQTQDPEVAKQFVDSINKMKNISTFSGLQESWLYSTEGRSRGAQVGPQALVSNTTKNLAKLPHQDLKRSADHRYGLNKIVGSRPSGDQDEAMKKLIGSEAFYLSFRDQVTDYTRDLTERLNQEKDDIEKKRQLAADLNEVRRLEKQLKSVDRFALFWSSMFAKSGQAKEERLATAEASYHALKQYLYEESKKVLKLEKQKDLLEDDFWNSPIGKITNEYAVDVAGLHLHNRGEYVSFSRKHGGQPKQNTTTELVIHGFTQQGDIKFTEHEFRVSSDVEKQLNEMMKKTHQDTSGVVEKAHEKRNLKLSADGKFEKQFDEMVSANQELARAMQDRHAPGSFLSVLGRPLKAIKKRFTTP